MVNVFTALAESPIIELVDGLSLVIFGFERVLDPTVFDSKLGLYAEILLLVVSIDNSDPCSVVPE